MQNVLAPARSASEEGSSPVEMLFAEMRASPHATLQQEVALAEQAWAAATN
jgi:hypothetical protein